MLPKKILDQQEVVKGWRIYPTGSVTYFTFTGYQGLDPEVDSNLSFGANPNTMQF